MQMLPLNGFGIAMILIGTVFLVYELITPSFGLFGSVGLILLSVGGWFLIDGLRPVALGSFGKD